MKKMNQLNIMKLWEIGINTVDLYLGNCLEVMKNGPDKSIDMILCDLPYGTTACKWDVIIPFDKLWEQYGRIIKDNAAIVLFASQPFTSLLIISKLSYFKYTWIWDKVNKFSGHLNSKKQPLRITEDVCIFYKQQPVYNPQMIPGKPYKSISSGNKSDNYGKQLDKVVTINSGLYYPKNLLSIPGDERGTEGRLHPTQKPIALLEYLIKTYTNESMTVLDNTMGSGSTGVACVNTNRNFIGIEKEQKYFDIAKQRIKEAQQKQTELLNANSK
jgi:site-specific DNA-methyltransferase (adenine-specific)